MARPIVCAYRLQLTPDFTLADARAVAPVVAALGASHLYLSPVWEARPGSAHGYDVTDPTAVRRELGGEEALRALAACGLGLLADLVPNHMAADEEHNPYWRDPRRRESVFDLDPRSGAHRRFFDVDGLAGVRQELPEIFAETHRAALALVREGVLDGLRIDHPDGLANPSRYLERLAEAEVEHVWVEKILERDEALPGWPVAGTTGYDFLALADGLFADPGAEEALTRLYADATGERRSFAEVAYEAKLSEARTTFAPEVRRLEGLLPPELVSTLDLAEALASFPVYRTYVEPDRGRVSAADRRAIARARLDERLARILLLEERGHDAFVVRWQQTTPPVVAKGVEDTAFYRYNRLLALNEVGADPGRFGTSPAEFHAFALERADRFPRSLLTATTHDTKRSADVRARLLALTALPVEWAELVERADAVDTEPIDANDAYLVLQTLVGGWPLGGDRLDAYLVKALREGKRRTSWVDRDPDYERCVCDHAARLVSDASFGSELARFADRVAQEANHIVRGLMLLRLTAPGVPDVYNGDELPFLALVDPDNRRPVDWVAVGRAIASPAAGSKVELLKAVLALRRERSVPFAGAYEPLDFGPDSIGYLRGGEVAVAVSLRGELPELRLPGVWDDVLPGPRARLLVRRMPS